MIRLMVLIVMFLFPLGCNATYLTMQGCVWKFPEDMIYSPEFSTFRTLSSIGMKERKSIVFKVGSGTKPVMADCTEVIGRLCLNLVVHTAGVKHTLISEDGSLFVYLNGFTRDEIESYYIGRCFF